MKDIRIWLKYIKFEVYKLNLILLTDFEWFLNIIYTTGEYLQLIKEQKVQYYLNN